MALTAANMKCSNFGTTRHWTYPSAADDVTAVGYFNALAANLQVGDVIQSVPAAGTPVDYAVTAITDGVVTIA